MISYKLFPTLSMTPRRAYITYVLMPICSHCGCGPDAVVNQSRAINVTTTQRRLRPTCDAIGRPFGVK